MGGMRPSRHGGILRLGELGLPEGVTMFKGLRPLVYALAASGTASLAALATAPPARADCIEAYARITWSDGHDTAVTPWAPGTCNVPTSFGTLTDPEVDDHEGWVPPSPPAPNGFFVQARVVSP
jgi:hypothetical protein